MYKLSKDLKLNLLKIRRKNLTKTHHANKIINQKNVSTSIYSIILQTNQIITRKKKLIEKIQMCLFKEYMATTQLVFLNQFLPPIQERSFQSATSMVLRKLTSFIRMKIYNQLKIYKINLRSESSKFKYLEAVK